MKILDCYPEHQVANESIQYLLKVCEKSGLGPKLSFRYDGIMNDTSESHQAASRHPAKDLAQDAKTSEWRRLRNRIIAGLFVLLPIYITYAIVRWLYVFLYDYAIGPIATFIRTYTFKDAAIPGYFLYGISVILAMFVVLSILMIAGIFAKSRVVRLTEWFLNKVPGVSTIYRVVSNVFEALNKSTETPDFKRVVLIEFPHPGLKAPAFVTSECQDSKTGSTILCVYVPTTPVPTSGYMLLVPEDSVIALDWNLEETLQAVVSGGITVPKKVSWA